MGIQGRNMPNRSQAGFRGGLSLEGFNSHFERTPQALVGGERPWRKLANQREVSFQSLHQWGPDSESTSCPKWQDLQRAWL